MYLQDEEQDLTQYNMLPYEKRMKKLLEIQKQTVEEIKEAWEELGRAIVIRPTGFGKTYTVGNLLRETNENGEPCYKNIAFIAPTTAIQSQFKSELLHDSDIRAALFCKIYENGKKVYSPAVKKDASHLVDVRLSTYQMMARLVGATDVDRSRLHKIFSDNLDLIIFDEFHHAGADKTLYGLLGLLEEYPSAKVVGLTATYDRSDAVDPAYELFKDNRNLVSEYNYSDAVVDGVLPIIDYYCHNYVQWKDKKKALEELENGEEVLNNPDLANQIKIWKQTVNAHELANMPDVIRKNTKATIGEENLKYTQKWMIFSPNHAHILLNKDEIIGWFREAYPGREIRDITVINTSECKKNLDLVVTKDTGFYNPAYEDGVIVLIFSVNMLLEGVHLDDVTGCLLFTATNSYIKYHQILGRVIDSQRKTKPLIMDMMADYDILLNQLAKDKETAYAVLGDKGGNAKDAKLLDKYKENVANDAELKNVLTAEEENRTKNKKELSKETLQLIKSMNVIPMKLTDNKFLQVLNSFEKTKQITRLAIQVMNNRSGFQAACIAHTLNPNDLLREIRRLNETHTLKTVKILLKSDFYELRKKHKILKVEETELVDPTCDDEPFCKFICEDDLTLDDDDLKELDAEYEKAIKWAKIKRAVKKDNKE